MKPTACAIDASAWPDGAAWARRSLQLADATDPGALTLEAVTRLIAEAHVRGRAGAASADFFSLQACRVCGCTDANACLDERGRGCSWAAPDLCSACEPFQATPVAASPEGGPTLLTVSKLIEALKALNPDARVFFNPDEGEPVQILGGIGGSNAEGPVVLLTPVALPDVGGF